MRSAYSRTIREALKMGQTVRMARFMRRIQSRGSPSRPRV